MLKKLSNTYKKWKQKISKKVKNNCLQTRGFWKPKNCWYKIICYRTFECGNLNKKNRKITTREHALKGYTSTYNVEILNSFYPKLQLKDTESAIKSKLIEYWLHEKALNSRQH